MVQREALSIKIKILGLTLSTPVQLNTGFKNIKLKSNKTTKNFKNTIDIHKSLTKSPNLYNGGRNCECSQHISFTPVPDWGALSALCCTDQLTVIPLPLPLPQLPVHAPPTAPGACCAWVSIYCLIREMFLMLLFSSLGFRIKLKLDSFH